MFRTVFLVWSEASRTASELDRQIANCLMEDGRMSGRDIAQRIGVSEATVSRRLAALEDEKLLVVRGFIQPESVGCFSTSIARFRVDGDARKSASALASLRGFHRVAQIDGGQEVTALLIAPDNESALRHIDTALTSISMIRLDRVSEILQIVPPSRAISPMTPSRHARVPRQADIQTKVLQAVRTNMRRSLNHVSNEINASPSATRSNLDHMIETGVITTVVSANPHFMGTPIFTQLRIRLRDRLYESLKVLRDLLPSAWIFHCLDSEALIAECAFASTTAAEQKSLEIQRALDGAEVSTHLLLEIHSDLLDWWCDAPCKAAGN